MLHVPVQYVRWAVDELSADFTGESFPFDERNWRIGPSDVKRIQAWIIERDAELSRRLPSDSRRVRVKRIVSKSPSSD